MRFIQHFFHVVNTALATHLHLHLQLLQVTQPVSILELRLSKLEIELSISLRFLPSPRPHKTSTETISHNSLLHPGALAYLFWSHLHVPCSPRPPQTELQNYSAWPVVQRDADDAR
jgi:hypothetical protein